MQSGGSSLKSKGKKDTPALWGTAPSVPSTTSATLQGLHQANGSADGEEGLYTAGCRGKCCSESFQLLLYKDPAGKRCCICSGSHGGSSSPACGRLYPAPALKQQAVRSQWLALRWAGSVPQQTLAPQNDVGRKLQDRVLQRRWRRWSSCSVKQSEAVSESLWHEMTRFQSEHRRPTDSRVFIVNVHKNTMKLSLAAISSR